MSALTDILLAPDVRPFAVAAAIMMALGGIELLAMLIGFSISELVGKEVTVEAPGGKMIVRWDGPGQHLWLTGPAVTVYEGAVELEQFS